MIPTASPLEVMESLSRFDLAKKIVATVTPILKDAISECKDYSCKTSSHDIVTKYDVLVETQVKRLIHENFPSDALVGEELGGNQNSEYTWYIDPIDGTTNFVNQGANFAISIGCFHDGQAIFGIVKDIRRDESYMALLGQGAFVNNSRIAVSSPRTVKESVLYTSNFMDLYDWDMFHDGLRSFAGDVRAVRCMGCVSLEICQVASGHADMMIALKAGSWDYSGAKPILEEAGGCMCDLFGNDIAQGYAGPVLAFSSEKLKNTVVKEYLK